MKISLILFISLLFCSILSVSSKKCKRQGPPEGIIGGKKVEKGQFPFMIYLLNMERKTQCGAAIVSPSHLITAAHCIVNKNKNGFTDVKNLHPFAGITNLGNKTGVGSQRWVVKSIRTHPKYDMKNSNYEIAILKLTKNVLWSSFVKPIRFGNEMDKTNLKGVKMIAVGWGNTDTFGPEGKSPYDLQFATLVGVDCGILAVQLSKDVFCARGEKGENVCSGDSGGPIVCKDTKGKDYLCGFSSKSQCEKGVGVLGRINYYSDLIRNALKHK